MAVAEPPRNIFGNWRKRWEDKKFQKYRKDGMENSVPSFLQNRNETFFIQLLSEQRENYTKKKKKIVQYCNMKKMYFLRK